MTSSASGGALPFQLHRRVAPCCHVGRRGGVVGARANCDFAQAVTTQTVAQKAPQDGGTHNALLALAVGSAEIAAQQACGAHDDLRDDGCEDQDPQRRASHQLELFWAAARSPLSPYGLLSALFVRVSVSAPTVARVGPRPSAVEVLAEQPKARAPHG